MLQQWKLNKIQEYRNNRVETWHPRLRSYEVDIAEALDSPQSKMSRVDTKDKGHLPVRNTPRHKHSLFGRRSVVLNSC